MKKLLFISNSIDPALVGGREQLTRLIRDALGAVSECQLETLELKEGSVTGRASVCEKLKGHIDGATPEGIAVVIEFVRRAKVKKVVLNGSNLGRVAEGVRIALPDVEILTFFHNCEARFFFGSMRHRPSFRSIGILIANYRAERLAVKHSDKLICLSERDSQQLQSLYGRSGTHIFPMAMPDRLPKDMVQSLQPPAEKYALFVGGTFYANRQGIEWYVDNVASLAPIKTYVVGKGFEDWKERLERNGNVEVIGCVDNLAPWYLGAHLVIAPIFDGSGMKTKVAEALMYGKRIVGTVEAFSGYEAVADRVGECCQTPDQFLNALEREASRPYSPLDGELREIYERQYSTEAARARLNRILGDSGERVA